MKKFLLILSVLIILAGLSLLMIQGNRQKSLSSTQTLNEIPVTSASPSSVTLIDQNTNLDKLNQNLTPEDFSADYANLESIAKRESTSL